MKCQKCGKEYEKLDKIEFSRGDETISTIHICEDCSEKALVVLADALELADRD